MNEILTVQRAIRGDQCQEEQMSVSAKYWLAGCLLTDGVDDICLQSAETVLVSHFIVYQNCSIMSWQHPCQSVLL